MLLVFKSIDKPICMAWFPVLKIIKSKECQLELNCKLELINMVEVLQIYIYSYQGIVFCFGHQLIHELHLVIIATLRCLTVLLFFKSIDMQFAEHDVMFWKSISLWTPPCTVFCNFDLIDSVDVLQKPQIINMQGNTVIVMISEWWFADPVFWPVFVVATLASVVGSQAVISATFSIINQCLALGCFPRVKVVHTSKNIYGQIYIPEINWIMLIICVAVTVGFQNTIDIGNAYGTLPMIMSNWRLSHVVGLSFHQIDVYYSTFLWDMYWHESWRDSMCAKKSQTYCDC